MNELKITQVDWTYYICVKGMKMVLTYNYADG